MTKPRISFKERPLLWIGVGAFVLTVLFVNPFREASIRDDWAYARTVEHLLATGQYRLSEWAAANMPFQVYYGGLFARLLGYSFSSLRISTLTLAFAGLIGFNYLAKEHGLDHTQADLLTLCLFASPLFLHFSFNFMTDVPFLTCLIFALLFYTKAIRMHSYALMILASTAAAAAILTRQFGIALVAGVLTHWVLGKERRRQALFFLAGLTLPTIAGLWQLYTGILTPNWTARGLRYLQFQYLADTRFFLANLLWRPVEILQYLALFCLPLILPALIAVASETRKKREHAFKMPSIRVNMIFLGVLSTYALAGMFYAHFANHRSLSIPYLEGSLDGFQGLPGLDLGRAILTPVTLIGAILLGCIVLLRYCSSPNWENLPAHERLLDHVTLFLLLLHLIYFQFQDEYLLVFLPFALIILGRHLGDWLNRFRVATAIACLIVLVPSIAWTRAALGRAEAYWSGGEFARSTGTSPTRIYASTWEWVSYYRFQDYLAEAGDRAFKTVSDYDLVRDYLTRWLPEQKQGAQIWVTEGVPSPRERWQILKTLPYRDIFFQNKTVYVARRLLGRADYWFAEHLNGATIEAPMKDYVAVSSFYMNNSTRPVMFEHPSARIAFNMKLPQQAFLYFGMALRPETWGFNKGDGVQFEILVQDGSSSEVVFSRYVDPKHNPGDRKWQDAVVDLSSYGGKQVIISFVTMPGPNSDNAFDWACWSNPCLIIGHQQFHYSLMK